MKPLHVLREEIKEAQRRNPNGEISAGLYIDKVGSKYVYALDTWEGTQIVKYPIRVFHRHFVR